MRKTLRILALVLVAAAIGLWVAAGANRDWTRTSEEVQSADAITGLVKREWKGTFVPGVDFLGASLAVATTIVGISFLFPKKKIETRPGVRAS